VITLNRPEARNAMSDPMNGALAATLADFDTNPDVRCIVLTGAGGAFCAGGDVKGFAAGRGATGGPTGPDAGTHNQRLSQRATTGALYMMPKPTIAALPGPAAGAGLGFALACDMRVAVETTVITTAFAKVGFSGDYGVTWFLTQLLGPSKAKEMMYLSPRIDMPTALEMGLVNRLTTKEDFEPTWRSLAAELAAGPTIAYRYMNENVNRAVGSSLFDCMDVEVTHHRHCGTTEDHKNAARSFVNKETPVFHGR
jgi:2-(1,2-epoxy-1,2-dihydrophenyl)acetyl-CoA isomerase